MATETIVTQALAGAFAGTLGIELEAESPVSIYYGTLAACAGAAVSGFGALKSDSLTFIPEYIKPYLITGLPALVFILCALVGRALKPKKIEVPSAVAYVAMFCGAIACSFFAGNALMKALAHVIIADHWGDKVFMLAALVGPLHSAVLLAGQGLDLMDPVARPRGLRVICGGLVELGLAAMAVGLYANHVKAPYWGMLCLTSFFAQASLNAAFVVTNDNPWKEQPAGTFDSIFAPVMKAFSYLTFTFGVGWVCLASFVIGWALATYDYRCCVLAWVSLSKTAWMSARTHSLEMDQAWLANSASAGPARK